MKSDILAWISLIALRSCLALGSGMALLGSSLEAEVLLMGPCAPPYQLRGVSWQPVRLSIDSASCFVALPGDPSCLCDTYEYKLSSAYEGSYYLLVTERDRPSQADIIASNLIKACQNRLENSGWDDFEVKLVEGDLPSIKYSIECIAHVGDSCLFHHLYCSQKGRVYHLYVWSPNGSEPLIDCFDTLRIEE